MSGLAGLVEAVPEPDGAVAAAARAELDRKAKPRGSLGRLEEVAAVLAAVRGTLRPRPLRPVVVVAAADHGVAGEGVSAYPSEVTRQMVAALAAGGAGVCALARAAGARLVVADAGVAGPPHGDGVRDLRLGAGTANAAAGPAMPRAAAERGILLGAALARELAEDGHGVVCLGEMGIGNSTAAAAVAASLLGLPAEETCGPGTGLDEAGLARKAAVVGRMLAVNRPDPDDPVDVLRAVGGYELAVLAGVALGAAAARRLVVLDGFIASTAALAAARLAPRLVGSLVAAHRSPEPGHARVLAALGLEPLLDLRLRLGEGSGAALALPLLEAAAAVLEEMATFDGAGVTDTGR